MSYSAGEFEKILKSIKSGETPDGSRLLAFLTLESEEDRYRVNLELAEAYYRRSERLSDGQSLRHAKSCVDRALLLSHFSPEVLPPLIKISRALNDVAAIKEALKRIGIEQAARGNFDEALSLFDRWAYADAEFTNLDTHSYDPDILACIERMTALHRAVGRERPLHAPGSKMRLAYLMQGLTEVNNVLVKIDRVFARLHDKSRFEVAYFTTDSESAVAGSSDARAAIESIRDSGCQMIVPPDCPTTYERLLSVGERIRDFAPDVLVTSGGLATFRNYFITRLKPAPVTIALHQGPSPQFSWHDFNHSISWFRALMLDCPADCSHVPLEIGLPVAGDIHPVTKSALDIPAAATIVASGGRWQKFQGSALWDAVIELLQETDDIYWVFLGFSEEQVPLLRGRLTPDVKDKIRFTGWRRDYLNLLAAADLFVDSYPLGGGVMLIEAMSLGLAPLSFEHDYMSVFNNGDGSGGDEILGFPDLLLKRGDFAQLKARISELARDEDRRRRIGQLCRERANQIFGEPSRMVQRCEEIYERVLREREARADSDYITPDDYKLSLIEREAVLNRREAELKRRETRQAAKLLPGLARGLRRRWRESRGGRV